MKGRLLSHLKFADDIVLMARDPADLLNRLPRLDRESIRVGLKINEDNIKIMFNSYCMTDSIIFH